MWTALALPMAYVGALVTTALVVQSQSTVPAWTAGAPVEYFTSALLWMLSLICVVLAGRNLTRVFTALFWLAGSAGLAALAVDEVMEFHERSSQVIGNDEPFKLAAWAGAGVVLYIIGTRHTQSRPARVMLLAGYVLQTLWLLADLGDGDLFRVRGMTIRNLRYTEEVLELLFLGPFLVGFTCLMEADVRPASVESPIEGDAPLHRARPSSEDS